VVKKADNEYSVEELEQVDELLFIRLQKEKMARFNWRRVMTMISIVKHLGSRQSSNLFLERKENTEEK
jgi:hypothetical protein